MQGMQVMLRAEAGVGMRELMKKEWGSADAKAEENADSPSAIFICVPRHTHKANTIPHKYSTGITLISPFLYLKKCNYRAKTNNLIGII